MFFLFADAEAPPSELKAAQEIRNAFAPVFEDIGDIAIIDSFDTLKKAMELRSEERNILLIVFGVFAISRCSNFRRILPVVTENEYNRISELRNAISIIRVGQDASYYSPQEFTKKSLTSSKEQKKNSLQRPKFSENGGSNEKVDVDWPMWERPHIGQLRSYQVDAEKSISKNVQNKLVDSHPDNNRFNGVVFAANRPVSIHALDLQELVSTFIETFRHNSDVLLRICFIHDDLDKDVTLEIRSNIEKIISQLGKFKCEVLCLEQSTQNGTPLERFKHASYYIASTDLTDIFDVTGYVCTLSPPILMESHKAALKLPDYYPLAMPDATSLQATLKDAYHIARTAPEGYQQLRKIAANLARELFSTKSAVDRIRTLLNGENLRKELPNIDARKKQEADFTELIGLSDFSLSGWLNFEDRMLAPGFEIRESDVVVDIGCGGGGFSRFSSKLARELIFCDINPSALQAASEHIKEVAKCPVRGILTSGEELSIEDNYADKIVCTEVLEHVQNPHRVLNELVRIGKPGSTYLISVPDYLGELLQQPVAPSIYFEAPNHIRIYERTEFAELISESGLEIISHDYWGFYHVFHWMIKWCDDPSLEYLWAKLWKKMLDNPMGMATKSSLDEHIAKSQSIIARKPTD